MNKKYILIILVLLGLAVIVGIYFVTSNKKPQPKITPTCTGKNDKCDKDCKCLTTDNCSPEGICTPKIPMCTGNSYDCNNSCKCPSGTNCNDAGNKCLPSCDQKLNDNYGDGYNCKSVDGNCICSDNNSCDDSSGLCYCRGEDHDCNDKTCICEQGKACSIHNNKCLTICNGDEYLKECDVECACGEGEICTTGKCFTKWTVNVKGRCDNGIYKCQNNYECKDGKCICSGPNDKCGIDCVCSATATATEDFCNDDNKCKKCDEKSSEYSCGKDCLCESGLCGADGKCNESCTDKITYNCRKDCKCEKGFTCNKEDKCEETCVDNNCNYENKCQCRLGTECILGQCTQEPIIIYGYEGKKFEITSEDVISYTTKKGTAQEQDIVGCWTLDDFKDANGDYPLKGAYGTCAVTSLTLPDNIKAEGYTAYRTWEKMCSSGGHWIEEDIVSERDISNIRKKPCGFKFTEINPTDI